MRIKIIIKTPNKHFYYHKRVLKNKILFMIFVSFNQTNKHTVKIYTHNFTHFLKIK